MKTRYLYNSLIILGCFCVYKYSKYLYTGIPGGREQWLNIDEISRRLILLLTGIVLAFLANYIINKRVSLIDFGIGMKGFLKGILSPSFEILLDMFPELIYTMENINNNLDQWTKMNNDEFQSKKILMEKSSESEDGVGKRKNKKIEFSTNKSKASSLKFEIHYQLINLDETIIDT